MIDINFLRSNPEIVRENIRKKFQDKKLPLVDEVLELDAKRRELQREGDARRAQRNSRQCPNRQDDERGEKGRSGKNQDRSRRK